MSKHSHSDVGFYLGGSQKATGGGHCLPSLGGGVGCLWGASEAHCGGGEFIPNIRVTDYNIMGRDVLFEYHQAVVPLC